MSAKRNRSIQELGKKLVVSHLKFRLCARSGHSATQIYTHVLDERMKAMVRDLRPLIGE
jgi:hypothetical protein